MYSAASYSSSNSAVSRKGRKSSLIWFIINTHTYSNPHTYIYIVHTHTQKKRTTEHRKVSLFGVIVALLQILPFAPDMHYLSVLPTISQSLSHSLSFSASFCLPLSLSLLHFAAAQSKSYELPTNFMHAVWFLFLLLLLLLLYSLLLLLSCTCQEALITVKLKIICKLCPGLRL